MSRMRVIIKDPGQKARAWTIENELETLQYIVDGYIEAVQLGCGVVAICDEEGKLKGKKPNYPLPNGDCLVGTVIFCSTKGEDFAGLTDEQAEVVKGWLE